VILVLLVSIVKMVLPSHTLMILKILVLLMLLGHIFVTQVITVQLVQLLLSKLNVVVATTVLQELLLNWLVQVAHMHLLLD
jgi:hypothetical protein